MYKVTLSNKKIYFLEDLRDIKYAIDNEDWNVFVKHIEK